MLAPGPGKIFTSKVRSSSKATVCLFGKRPEEQHRIASGGSPVADLLSSLTYFLPVRLQPPPTIRQGLLSLSPLLALLGAVGGGGGSPQSRRLFNVNEHVGIHSVRRHRVRQVQENRYFSPASLADSAVVVVVP